MLYSVHSLYYIYYITELRPIKPALHQARTLDLLLKRAEQVQQLLCLNIFSSQNWYTTHKAVCAVQAIQSCLYREAWVKEWHFYSLYGRKAIASHIKTDPQTGVVPRKNSIPQYAFEMSTIKVSAIQARSHSLLCSSSIHEPSDPPHRIVQFFSTKSRVFFGLLNVFKGWLIGRTLLR